MTYQQRLDAYRKSLIEGVKRCASALNRARTQQVDMATVKASLAGSFNRLRLLAQQDQKLHLKDLRPWLQQHARKLAINVGAPVAGILAIMLVSHAITIVSNNAALKPAQLTSIESLIQDSKTTGSSPSQAPALTDNDLETIRVILQNRGINPNILRLNLDSGIGIEIQADQAAFGQWVAFLEEIARRWQIYPAQLTLKASDQAEIVSIRGTLQQAQSAAP